MAKAKKAAAKPKKFRVAVTKTLYSTKVVTARTAEEACDLAVQDLEAGDDSCFDFQLENEEYSACDAFEDSGK